MILPILKRFRIPQHRARNFPEVLKYCFSSLIYLNPFFSKTFRLPKFSYLGAFPFRSLQCLMIPFPQYSSANQYPRLRSCASSPITEISPIGVSWASRIVIGVVLFEGYLLCLLLDGSSICWLLLWCMGLVLRGGFGSVRGWRGI